MTDTIDLLEAIGQDASLRHASAEDLGKVLAQAQASEALTAAVASGDSTRLSAEFGLMQNKTPEGILSPAREDEPEEEDPLEAPVPDANPLPSQK
ncbi:hypothetical protein [Dyella flagellata]|uniref:Uncharacterized protein n=1 Tax=Dyella flagellata TaxID=1867833 RepID=A0ABQ5X9H8_9GAMM|nr:hypothetical protein [Dyella flagellata]GLQ88330.1 hypothetical protein GCM10007898_18990 [Dyella flagellata]